MSSGRLPRSFYALDARTVAREALGKILVRRIENGVLLARIVETEAYVGPHDLACHASKGRTRRTEIMFGSPGYVYVYLVYGMHHMLNFVTGEEGDPQAVLVRAAEPVGFEHAAPNLSGPGRLTRAMGITCGDNGTDLCGDRLYLRSGPPPGRIVAGPRIGVDYAGEWARAPLRFHEKGNPHVSRRPAGRRE